MSQENFWNGGDPNSWPNWEPALLVPGVDPEEALASWRELEARDRRLLDRGVGPGDGAGFEAEVEGELIVVVGVPGVAGRAAGEDREDRKSVV